MESPTIWLMAVSFMAASVGTLLLQKLPQYALQWFSLWLCPTLLLTSHEEEYGWCDAWLYDQCRAAMLQLQRGQRTLAPGTYWFRWGGAWICAYKGDRPGAPPAMLNSGERPPQIICLRCWGGSRKTLEAILMAMQPATMEGVPLFFGSHGWWSSFGRRTGRALATVQLPAGLLEDVAHFLAPDQAARYHQVGVPYRRGYLLYGPPGTGKTTAILALATHFRLSVHIVSNKCDDQSLLELFARLPPRAMIVMEDVDALFTQVTQATQPALKPAGGAPLTLAGLLNAVDGLTDSDGRILVITTNRPEALPAALLRRGRCDRHFEFADTGFGERLRARLELSEPGHAAQQQDDQTCDLSYATCAG